jgi:hypothetical protein
MGGWKARKSSSLRDDKREGVGSECESHSLTDSPIWSAGVLLPLWVVFAGTRRVGRHELPKAVVELHALQKGSDS